jgi:ketosteroid isomerase-like protein
MKTAGFVLLLICFGARFTAAQQSAGAVAVTKVLALEHAWNQAEQSKDAKALEALFDDALLYIDYDGTLRTKAGFLERVKSDASQPQQETTESMTARAFGSTVVVTGIYVAKGVEKGKPYMRRGRFVDTWTFSNGSWLCVVSQATPIPHE